jgi:hypothetical protein
MQTLYAALIFLLCFAVLFAFYLFVNGLKDFIAILLSVQQTIRQKRAECIEAIKYHDLPLLAKRLEELWFMEAQLRNPFWLFGRFMDYAIVVPFESVVDYVTYLITPRDTHKTK